MSQTSLEERVQFLEDMEEIRQLKAQYCAGCDDDHNPERIAALFVEDGVWDWEGTAYCDGIDEIKKFMGDLRASKRITNSAHMVTNPEIRIGGERGYAHWRFIMLWTGDPPGGPSQYNRIIGYYQDDLVKRDGKWYFETLRPRVLESSAYPVEDSRFVD